MNMADTGELKSDGMMSESNDEHSLDDESRLGLLSGGLRLMQRKDGISRAQCVFLFCLTAFLWGLSIIFAVHAASSRCAPDGFATGFLTDLEPLKAFLEVKPVKFTGSLDLTENGTLYRTTRPGEPQYVGKPNAEIDANWDALLQVDAVDLTGAEAASIVDSTFQKPGGWSLVGVDAVHQLHCLNMMYRYMHQEYYISRDPPDAYEVHVHHCLDYLRQAIMCSVDISPIPILWSTKWNRVLDNFENWHMCRDYSKVQSWMLERSGLDHPLPKEGHPWPQPLPGPGVRDDR